MEHAELNGRQAAHLLGWSESWVSRLLSGKRGGSALDVRPRPGRPPSAWRMFLATV